MASRKDLALIRAARANQAGAQLLLGKRYLFGGDGLPQNLQTALHWLDRAAKQDEKDAWLFIGEHIPYDTLVQSGNPFAYLLWYERAYDAGIVQAAWVFAFLVLAHDTRPVEDGLAKKALRALEQVATTGLPEAQWLLAREQHRADLARSIEQAQTPDLEALYHESEAATWGHKAADAGVEQARYVMAEAAWMHSDWETFLRRAMPLGEELMARHADDIAQLHAPSDALAAQIGDDNMQLLSRLTGVLLCCEQANGAVLLGLLELQAYAGDPNAQLMLGSILARLHTEQTTVVFDTGTANYKKAIRWLEYAAAQGLPEAWYRLSLIYLKSEFSQRSTDDAYRHLERAAIMGHSQAQYECGAKAWRHRRELPDNDVQAVYWLQKAAMQQHWQARALLEKAATQAVPEAWAVEARSQLSHQMMVEAPFLTARIELAALFGLSRPEALLIDLHVADKGHCLVVDIRDDYARSKRRIILVSTGEERQALNRLGRIFEGIDGSMNGPEGNYRQRQYRLKTILSLLEDAA
jgi:TPR repeat protein